MSIRIFFVVLLLVYIVSFLIPSPSINIDDSLLSPSWNNFLGTDILGRDILTRIIVNVRYSIGVSLCTVCITAVLGTFIAIITVAHKHTYPLMMIVTTMLIAIPPFIICLLFVSRLGQGIFALILGQLLAFLPVFIRVSFKELSFTIKQEYAQVSIGLGNHPLKVCIHHGLPLLVPKLCEQMLSLFALAIGIESALSYLGLGPPLPNAGLGYMLYESIAYWSSAPWYPCAMLITFMLLLFTINSAIQLARKSLATPHS